MKAWTKYLVLGIACGVLVSVTTGLIENRPEGSVTGFRYYGYPLVWQVTKTMQSAEFILISLVIDSVFWTVVSLFSIVFVERIVFRKLGADFSYKTLFLPLALLIPLGLFMDCIHEFGHAFWGTTVGGTLAYMKIAYFEIFPQPAVTSQFILGYVEVNGLSTASQYGLFLLGGSLSTNIASWMLALTQVKMKLGQKTRVAVNTLGLLGFLDLPLYVLLPQVGLQHWFFVGGDTPEPLIGARKLGIPDTIFYVIVALTTLDLLLLYSKTLRQKIREKIAHISESCPRSLYS